MGGGVGRTGYNKESGELLPCVDGMVMSPTM